MMQGLGIFNKFKELQTSKASLNLPHKYLNEDINGISPGMMIGVAGENKSGKSRFVDYTFIIGLILENPDAKITIDKYSLEVSLIENIANFTSTLIYHQEDYELDPNIILGRKKNENKGKIILSEYELTLIKRVLPLLEKIVGVYDDDLNLIEPGIVNIITSTTNPTGIYKDLVKKASKYGTTIYEEYEVLENGTKVKKKKPLKFVNDSDTYMICIIDDIRLISEERGFDEKQNLDKIVQYLNELRLFYGYIFIPIQHMNRSISDIKRIVEMKEWLAPSSSDLKGSGNLGERCTQLLAIFNPCDPQYGLQKHFGRDLSIYNPRSPNYVGDYRSVHLILNRNGASGTQYGHLFKGKVSTFKEL